jgi:hypothetical protein
MRFRTFSDILKSFSREGLPFHSNVDTGNLANLSPAYDMRSMGSKAARTWDFLAATMFTVMARSWLSPRQGTPPAA